MRITDVLKLSADQRQCLGAVGMPDRVWEARRADGNLAHVFEYPGGVVAFIHGVYVTTSSTSAGPSALRPGAPLARG